MDLKGLVATLMWSGSVVFLTRPSLSTGIDFDVPVSTNVPEFSFDLVTEDEVFNTVMSIKSNAAGGDEIPLRFVDDIYIIGISKYSCVSLL
jgi:hypothetical protein